MAFAMKGGGVSRAINVFWKNDFLKKTFRTIPWMSKRVLHIVWALCYVVEVALNMTNITSSWQSAARAAEECQYLNQSEEDLK